VLPALGSRNWEQRSGSLFRRELGTCCNYNQLRTFKIYKMHSKGNTVQKYRMLLYVLRLPQVCLADCELVPDLCSLVYAALAIGARWYADGDA